MRWHWPAFFSGPPTAFGNYSLWELFVFGTILFLRIILITAGKGNGVPGTCQTATNNSCYKLLRLTADLEPEPIPNAAACCGCRSRAFCRSGARFASDARNRRGTLDDDPRAEDRWNLTAASGAASQKPGEIGGQQPVSGRCLERRGPRSGSVVSQQGGRRRVRRGSPARRRREWLQPGRAWPKSRRRHRPGNGASRNGPDRR
jgi:hypothetical protein